MPGALGHPGHGSRNGTGGGGPHKKHCIGIVQAFIERLGDREIAAHDLDSEGKFGSLWVASHRAD
jgi:hypothetical protein